MHQDTTRLANKQRESWVREPLDKNRMKTITALFRGKAKVCGGAK